MTTITEGSLGAAVTTDQAALDAVRKAKQKDIVLATGGLIVMAIAMTLLLTLIGDLVIRGAARIDYGFLTSYPSRLPERAGVLSAWVGSLLVMLVTVFLAIPIGIGAGLYLEEYARKGWLRTLSRSMSRTSPECRRSFTACWRWAFLYMVSALARRSLSRA